MQNTDSGILRDVTVKRIAIIAMLALVCSCAMALSCTDAAYASVKASPKMVMIGDSYSISSEELGVKKPWPERVASQLGLRKSDYRVYRHSGYGFAKSRRHFTQLLKRAKRDARVTDVLIVGGAGNDRKCSKPKIVRWYRKTIKRLRYLYPNATIMHAITSWDVNNASYRRLLTAHIPYYVDEAKKLDVVYLRGCETVLRNNPGYIGADGRHATEKGQRAMAKRLVKAICANNARYAPDKAVKAA